MEQGVTPKRFPWSCFTAVRLRVAAGLLVVLTVAACGNWGWERVTSDYDSELNVFALIAVDDQYPSFVSVHQTLGLEGDDYLKVPDTVWFGEDQYDFVVYYRYEPAYLVKDAVVEISDGTTDYLFHYIEFDREWWDPEKGGFPVGLSDWGMYLDTLGRFRPEPGRTYSLTVIVPDGRRVTGTVTTPPRPEIYADRLPDTLYLRKPYTITWKPLDYYQILKLSSRRPSGSYLGRRHVYLEPGDSVWIAEPREEDFWGWGQAEPDTLVITLHSLDDSYYEYFLSRESEIASLFLGVGNEGLAVNLSGGYGVLTAATAARAYRLMVP
jgi:hypothetical protein